MTIDSLRNYPIVLRLFLPRDAINKKILLRKLKKSSLEKMPTAVYKNIDQINGLPRYFSRGLTIKTVKDQVKGTIQVDVEIKNSLGYSYSDNEELVDAMGVLYIWKKWYFY